MFVRSLPPAATQTLWNRVAVIILAAGLALQGTRSYSKELLESALKDESKSIVLKDEPNQELEQLKLARVNMEQALQDVQLAIKGKDSQLYDLTRAKDAVDNWLQTARKAKANPNINDAELTEIGNDEGKIRLKKLALNCTGNVATDIQFLVQQSEITPRVPNRFLASTEITSGAPYPKPQFTPTMLFDILVTQAEGDVPFVLKPIIENLDNTMFKAIYNLDPNSQPSGDVIKVAQIQHPLSEIFPSLGPFILAPTWRSPNPLNKLKTLAEKDLPALPENLVNFLVKAKCKPFSNRDEFMLALPGFLKALASMRNGTDPMKAIGNMTPASVAPNASVLVKAMVGLDVICDAAYHIEEEAPLSKAPDSFKTVFNVFSTPEIRDAFVLVVQKSLAAKGIGQDPGLKGKVDEQLVKAIYATLSAFDQVQKLLACSHNPDPKVDTNVLARQYLNACFKVVATIPDLSGFLMHDGVATPLDLQTQFNSRIAPVLAIYGEIQNQDFLRGGEDLLSFLRSLDSEPQDPRNPSAAWKVMDELDYLINVAGPIASAKDQTSLNIAIKTILTPAGTYTLKRQVCGGHLFLNGYLGFEAGCETFIGQNRHAAFTSLAAPVGIEYSWGNMGGPTSIGILLAPVDLGNIVQVRYNSSYQSNSVSWREVTNPGLYVVFGLTRNYPVSIGVGAKYLPNTNNASTGTPMVRSMQFGMFLAWDVPFVKWSAGPAIE